MASRRVKYSAEFKEEAVKLVIEASRPVAQVARELGVHVNTINNWVNTYRDAHSDQEPALTTAERAQLRELKKENAELRMKNEFLGKAAAFFAQEYR